MKSVSEPVYWHHLFRTDRKIDCRRYHRQKYQKNLSFAGITGIYTKKIGIKMDKKYKKYEKLEKIYIIFDKNVNLIDKV